jgi:hypothetical protein
MQTPSIQEKRDQVPLMNGIATHRHCHGLAHGLALSSVVVLTTAVSTSDWLADEVMEGQHTCT